MLEDKAKEEDNLSCNEHKRRQFAVFMLILEDIELL
jgi:hypothetical protein